MEDLSYTLAQLAQAACPEDVFGALPGGREGQEDRLSSLFRQLARSVHYDRHSGSDQAQEAMRLLNTWRDQAKHRIAQGSYGQAAPLTSGHSHYAYFPHPKLYRRQAVFATGDLCDLYQCSFSEAGTPTQKGY